VEVGGQLYAAGKTPGNLGRTQSPFGRVWKISPPPEFDPRTVQPVVVVVRRVCLDSWWSYGGFSRQV